QSPSACGKSNEDARVEPIELTACSPRLNGIVLVNGVGASNLPLRLGDERALTDEVGRFSFCAEGRLAVLGYFYEPAVHAHWSGPKEAAKFVTISAVRGSSIHGVVSIDGIPHEGIPVWLEQEEPGPSARQSADLDTLVEGLTPRPDVVFTDRKG